MTHFCKNQSNSFWNNTSEYLFYLLHYTINKCNYFDARLIIFFVLFSISNKSIGQNDSTMLKTKSKIDISLGYASKASNIYNYHGVSLGTTFFDKVAFDYIFLAANSIYETIYTQVGVFNLNNSVISNSLGCNFIVGEYDKKIRLTVGSSIIHDKISKETIDLTKSVLSKENSVINSSTYATFNLGLNYSLTEKFKLNFTTLNFNRYAFSIKYRLSETTYKSQQKSPIKTKLNKIETKRNIKIY